MKPEPQTEGETFFWDEFVNASISPKIFNNFQLKVVSCWSLDKKLATKEELLENQSSTPGGATFNDDPRMLWSFSYFPYQNILGACWIHDIWMGCIKDELHMKS